METRLREVAFVKRFGEVIETELRGLPLIVV